MTLLYHDPSPGPKTHVFIMGVGRFPFLKGQSQKLFEGMRHVSDVTSPPNNAYAMVKLFAEAADKLIPPLGSIEVLISPTDGSQATLPKDTYPHDVRPDHSIAAATGDTVEAALWEWVDRCAKDPDNLALFYASSHGMEAQEHVLLLEDAGKQPRRPWDNMFSVHHLHRNLYGQTNKRSIILVDCCRDLLEEANKSLDPLSGRSIDVITDEQLAKAKADPERVVYVLRASVMGGLATATVNGLGFFTEALLDCISGNGVAGVHRPGYGWSVTPPELRAAVVSVGWLGLNFTAEELRPVDEDTNWVGAPFLKLQKQPRFPVRVREAAEVDDGKATLSLSNPAVPFSQTRDPMPVKPQPLVAWVDPHMEFYIASGSIPQIGDTESVDFQPLEVRVSDRGHDVPLRR